MAIKVKNGFCVHCDDNELKPCIGKRDKALCYYHYWNKHRRSNQQKKADGIYFKLRHEYLEYNPYCQLKLQGCSIKAIEIHHTKGRGINYLAVETWLAGCRTCHIQVNENPDEAIALGLADKRLNK